MDLLESLDPYQSDGEDLEAEYVDGSDVQVIPLSKRQPLNLFDVVMDKSGPEEADLIDIEFIDNSSAFQTTQKQDISWTRRSFVTKKFDFIPPEVDVNVIDPKLSPLYYFFKYIPKSLFEQMATYTNLYAEQSDANRFHNTSAPEMIKFFGINILMGNLKLGRLKTYWDRDLGIDYVNDAMTYDRFIQLRSNIHFVDKRNIPEDCQDKFVLVRPLIDSIRNRCLEKEVEEFVCIDEQIIPFKGRLNIKQYVKGKPSPWGVKNFVLCGKSGYPYDFVLYQGKDSDISVFDVNKYGFGTAVVIHLMKRITKTGHTLYCDNYFTSYQLFEIMHNLKINAAGTVRINRFKSPPLLSDKDLKLKGRGCSDEVVSTDGKVVVVKWQDNRSVHIASNYVGKGKEVVVSRWDKKKARYVDIKQPEVVNDYNFAMGGVDLLDQYISYYRIFIKSKKWTLRIISHFIDFASVISWIEYKEDYKNLGEDSSQMLDLYHFRLRLAKLLVTANHNKRGRPPANQDPVNTQPNIKKSRNEVRPLDDIRHDGFDHLPQHDSEQKSASRCKFPNCQGKSRVFCGKCKVHLCLNSRKNCFHSYHVST